jgi:hypothetical protein
MGLVRDSVLTIQLWIAADGGLNFRYISFLMVFVCLSKEVAFGFVIVIENCFGLVSIIRCADNSVGIVIKK